MLLISIVGLCSVDCTLRKESAFKIVKRGRTLNQVRRPTLGSPGSAPYGRAENPNRRLGTAPQFQAHELFEIVLGALDYIIGIISCVAETGCGVISRQFLQLPCTHGLDKSNSAERSDGHHLTDETVH